MIVMKKSFWILLFLVMSVEVVFSLDRLRFEHISSDQGLSDNSVNCILQDRDGYMWFGCVDGLNRYDGYGFTVYNKMLDRPGSLKHNAVFALCEDHRNRLWVGTWEGGLARFERDSESFTTYMNDPHDPHSISDNRIIALYQDSRSRLWVGTEGGGLNLYREESQRFVHFRHDPENSATLSHDVVSGILEDRDGTLWVATKGGGLNRMDADKGTFVSYRHDPSDPESLSNDTIWCMVEDLRGNLWLGTENGLNQFNPESGSFRHIRHDPDNTNSLSHNYIRSLYHDREGNLWIGTLGGLNIFDWSQKMIFRYRSSRFNPHSITSEQIYSLFEDRSGIIWVGTFGGGINKVNRQNMKFRYYSLYPHLLSGSDHQFVRCMVLDSRERLWVGTLRGLKRVNRRTGDIMHFQHLKDNPSGLSHDRVVNICEGPSGHLWIGTWGGGLNRFDPQKETFLHYRHDPENPHSISSDIILDLFLDSRNTLWIGTDFGGMCKLDRDKNRFIRYTSDPSNPDSLNNNIIMNIIEDHTGILWIGTYGGGLNRLDPLKETFTHFTCDPDDPESLSHDIVLCVHEDQQGNLWIGTMGGGLNRFNRKTGKFTRYGRKDGLSNNCILGILEDARGNLWMSTNLGLNKFNPRTGKFLNFTWKDGLQGNEFNMWSYHKSSSGEMFFGGVKGLNSFFPETIQENSYIPRIVFTAVKRYRRDSIQEQHFIEEGSLTLSYKDSITFEFAALDYSNPEKNQYAYMLEGLNERWIEMGNNHKVTFANMKPGTYTLRVKGTNSSGRWTDQTAAIQLAITPPFWQTWWFRLIMVGLICLLILRWHFNRMKKQESRLKNETLRERFFIKNNISAREREVILLILKGRSNREIEDELFISLGTVKNHIYSIYQKLNINSRVQLVNTLKNITIDSQ